MVNSISLITKNVDFFLKIKGYIGEFEIIDDHRSGKIVVNLNGRLNKVKAKTYRFECLIYFFD
jgi:ribosomal protein S8